MPPKAKIFATLDDAVRDIPDGASIMFGGFGGATAATSLAFLSQEAISAGVPQRLGLQKTAAPVRNCRRTGKKDLLLNDATPNIEVDPETYEVRVDGALLSCEPARVLPLAQRYFLF